MDKITKTLIKNFASDFELQDVEGATLFEYFTAFSVVASEVSSDVNFQDIVIGNGNDTGIDAIAVFLNGTQVEGTDEIDHIADVNGYFDVLIVFVQAKRSSSFDLGGISKFGDGVIDFFRDEPRLTRNEDVKVKSELVNYVLLNYADKMRKNPVCKLYYVTTGTWKGDDDLAGKMLEVSDTLRDKNLFSDVDFTPLGAREIQDKYRASNESFSKTFKFERHVVMPEIRNITSGYVGLLPVSEFIKIITDNNDHIIEKCFYDNVRGFLGMNTVNNDILGTLSSDGSDGFPAFNNGVTIVARDIQPRSDSFTIHDYQIVNGCQTSHVIYRAKDNIDNENTYVPIKLIVTNDDSVINKTIKSSNNQTEVSSEELLALSDFQKNLERFYETYDGDERLYYERRNNQYARSDGVEKVRIVSIREQIKTFASMFLEKPHAAARYYGALVDNIGDDVFSSDHEPVLYYSSAYAWYVLEFMFRNKVLDRAYRKFRYHMLLAFRCSVSGVDRPNFNSKRQVGRCCQNLLDVLHDKNSAHDKFKEVSEELESMGVDIEERSHAKKAGFTENIKSFYR